ncbi:DUF4145 domain-containing protein [Azospirillum sp. SYSU D00513]|uniref:DUF4145 domain-containing protein n=1 Tax=Azospirillum sp. SYSU D00513 TaxID=2812561 RepID=UPI001A96D007|nr:DUF4145 domain-containing protein [Azospirillum sp. SYSU D00513]
MEAPEALKIKRAHCNGCLGLRKQFILGETKWRSGSVVAAGYEFEYHRCLFALKCCGCDHFNIKEEGYFTDIGEEPSGDPEYENYYPSKMFRKLPGRSSFHSLRKHAHIYDLLEEVIHAYHGEHYRLAGMGLRSVLDYVLTDILEGDKGFQEKIDWMVEKGHISQRDKSTLAKFIEIGNAAVHRGFAPSQEDVDILLDYAMTFLRNFYDFDASLAEIHGRVPPSAPKLPKLPKSRTPSDGSAA